MRGKKLLKCFVMLLCVSSILGKTNDSKADTTGYIYSKPAIKKRIVKQAINHGLDPALALSVAKQESAFKRDAKSHVGAIGLFQLMPGTAKDLGVNPYYINQNIKGGVSYLKTLKTQFGSTEKALAAYNAGPGAVSRYGGIPPYRETKHYVKNIMHYYNNYKQNPDPIIEEVKAEIALSEKAKETVVKVETESETSVDENNIAFPQSGTSIAIGFISKIFSFFS